MYVHTYVCMYKNFYGNLNYKKMYTKKSKLKNKTRQSLTLF